MKRYGYLFDRVCTFDALRDSAMLAAKGKKSKPRVAQFIMDLENEVIALERELLDKTYRPLPFHTFMIHDPKERMICAADFRDRVVHHALCGVLEPIFERTLIPDSFACRKNKGTHRAIARAQRFCRKYPYFLKLDVHKYFDSIDHDILKTLIRRKVKDADLLWLIDCFIEHPVPWTAPGKGIPIGNLTSQHFANFYLSGLDHFIKESLHIKGYLRYMDDMVLFSRNKAVLWEAEKRICMYLDEKLSLKLKSDAILLAQVMQGLPFLGFRTFPGVIRVSRKGWRRFRRKVIMRDSMLAQGEINSDQWIRSVASLVGCLKKAQTRNLRASFFKARGV